MGQTLVVITICVLLIIAYKIGRWQDQWYIEMLQTDNIRLAGETHRLIREIERGDYQVGKKIPSLLTNIINEDTGKPGDTWRE